MCVVWVWAFVGWACCLIVFVLGVLGLGVLVLCVFLGWWARCVCVCGIVVCALGVLGRVSGSGLVVIRVGVLGLGACRLVVCGEGVSSVLFFECVLCLSFFLFFFICSVEVFDYL